MVLITSAKASEAAASSCKLVLESGKCIDYVAPAHANLSPEIQSESNDIVSDDFAGRRKSSYGGKYFITLLKFRCRFPGNALVFEDEDFSNM